MKRSFIMSLTVGVLFAAGLVGCKSEINDTKNLQGTWTLVSGETEGEPLPEQDVKNAKLTIEGDTYTVQLGDMGVKKGKQKLDSTKMPKHIDAHDAEGPTVGLNLGIYEITATGDFRVCFAATGKDRPTEFVTKPGSGQFIHMWRRAKAE